MLQWTLTIATLLGGVAAVWYFWDKIAGLWRHAKVEVAPIKPPLSQNPTHEDIFQAILTSQPTDWGRVSTNDSTVISFVRDANLRLQMFHSDQGVHSKEFREPWANKFPDSSATGYWCDLLYGSTLIKRFVLVAVDGGRALLPIPQYGQRHDERTSVRRIDYQVARIFDTLGNLDKYMEWAGLKISNGAV